MIDGVITFAIALMTTFGLTVPVRRFALHFGIVDQPNPRKLHHSPMPLLGGLAIYCGTVLAVVLSLGGQPRGQILGILGAGTLLLITGILDDRGLLHHQIKLFDLTCLGGGDAGRDGSSVPHHFRDGYRALPGKTPISRCLYCGRWGLQLRSASWTTWMVW